MSSTSLYANVAQTDSRDREILMNMLTDNRKHEMMRAKTWYFISNCISSIMETMTGGYDNITEELNTWIDDYRHDDFRITISICTSDSW